MKQILWKQFFVCTILPIVIPFISIIPEEHISLPAQNVLIILCLTLDVIFASKYYRQTNKEQQRSLVSKITRTAYSNAFVLSESKRNYIIDKSYNKGYSIPESMVPYNVRTYIREICENFRDTISQITQINREHMSVTFIYHYVYEDATDSDKSWRWVGGKESTTRIPLDTFVNRKDSLFYYLVNGSNGSRVNSVFYNDKKDLARSSHYYMSPRDIDHGKIGSVFAVNVNFGNNAETFVEGILLVSTYGKQFIEKDNDQYSEKELKNLLLEELFPYYQRLLETELGMLYLMHTQ